LPFAPCPHREERWTIRQYSLLMRGKIGLRSIDLKYYSNYNILNQLFLEGYVWGRIVDMRISTNIAQIWA